MKKYYLLAIEKGDNIAMNHLGYYYKNKENNYILMKKYFLLYYKYDHNPNFIREIYYNIIII